MEINNSKLKRRMVEDFSNLAVIYAHILCHEEGYQGDDERQIINRLLAPIIIEIKKYKKYERASSFSKTKWKKQEANFQKLIKYTQDKDYNAFLKK